MGRLFQIARTSSASCASLDWLVGTGDSLGSGRAEATQDGPARTFRSTITTLPASANATVTTFAGLLFRLVAPASAVHAGSLPAICANWIQRVRSPTSRGSNGLAAVSARCVGTHGGACRFCPAAAANPHIVPLMCQPCCLFTASDRRVIRNRRPVHPADLDSAHAPLLSLLTEMFMDTSAVGELRTGANSARTAAIVMKTVISIAQFDAEVAGTTGQPMSSDEA